MKVKEITVYKKFIASSSDQSIYKYFANIKADISQSHSTILTGQLDLHALMNGSMTLQPHRKSLMHRRTYEMHAPSSQVAEVWQSLARVVFTFIAAPEKVRNSPCSVTFEVRNFLLTSSETARREKQILTEIRHRQKQKRLST